MFAVAEGRDPQLCHGDRLWHLWWVYGIKDGEDWVELINNFTSEYAISKTGIDFQSTPVLKVFFVLGETSLSVQSAREIMDLFENWSEEPTFTECYFISDRVKGPSRIVLMAERVEWDAFYEGLRFFEDQKNHSGSRRHA